jgi:hypothetical protein
MADVQLARQGARSDGKVLLYASVSNQAYLGEKLQLPAGLTGIRIQHVSIQAWSAETLVTEPEYMGFFVQLYDALSDEEASGYYCSNRVIYIAESTQFQADCYLNEDWKKSQELYIKTGQFDTDGTPEADYRIFVLGTPFSSKYKQGAENQIVIHQAIAGLGGFNNTDYKPAPIGTPSF